MDNLSSWFFTLANPASQFGKVLLYDLRGHGMSDRPLHGYSIEQQLDDLRMLIELAADEGPVILVGNSFGGLMALNFASRYPERVAGLVLVDAQINDSEWKSKMLRSLRLTGEERDRMIIANFQNWLGRNSARKSNRLAKNAHELIYETRLLDDLQFAEDLSDADLARIDKPCLAIYGGDSDIIASAHRLESVLPDCTLHVFEGSTHSILWEQTDAVKALILDELQMHSSAGVVEVSLVSPLHQTQEVP